MNGVRSRRWSRGWGGGGNTVTRKAQSGRRRQISTDNGNSAGSNAFHRGLKPHLEGDLLIRRKGEAGGKVRITKTGASDRDAADLYVDASAILQRHSFRTGGLKDKISEAH